MSRAQHEVAKTRHAQREGFAKKPVPFDEGSWLSEGLKVCRFLGQGAIKQADFADMMDINLGESDRRLRYLTRIGFLRMEAHRSNGVFTGYEWFIVDPTLPEK
jgi:hypothetical protein